LSVNIGGVLYEQQVKTAITNVIRDYSLPLEITDDNSGAFNAHTNDLMLSVRGIQYDIEIKMANAQMGSSGFSFDGQNFTKINQDLDDDISNLFVENLLNERKEYLNTLIRFLQKQEPVDFHSSIDSFSCRSTRDSWKKAKDKGLLVPINGKFESDERMIRNLYNKKGVYYIQVQKRGLYYLGQNPLNLPVPELKATTKLLVRVRRGGHTLVKKINEDVGNSDIMATSKILLKSCPKSPHSLDNEKSILELFR
jgi:hypothetical protein